MMSILLSVELWPNMDYSLWPTVIFEKNVTDTLKTSLESSFYADHNGTILSFKSHSHTECNVLF